MFVPCLYPGINSKFVSPKLKMFIASFLTPPVYLWSFDSVSLSLFILPVICEDIHQMKWGEETTLH